MKAVQWYLADLLLGETPSLDINTVCSFPEAWVSVAKQTLENVTSDFYVMALNYTTYAGTYSHQAFGNITVYLNTTRHYLNVKQGRLGHAVLKQTDTLHQCQLWISTYSSQLWLFPDLNIGVDVNVVTEVWA